MPHTLRALQPLPRSEHPVPPDALPLAGGWSWFDTVIERRRDAPPRRCHVSELCPEERDRLSASRPLVMGLSMDAPRLMGIVNVTPDSFSDGGQFFAAQTAVAHGNALRQAGADILDIGGESTRPGAVEVDIQEERDRVLPVIEGLGGAPGGPISIDTRKAGVAAPALDAGAGLVNDVSALTHDAALGPLVAARGVPVCLMHAQGTPETMQTAPRYDDVLLDVFDGLAARIAAAEAAGIARDRIVVDPGIGFGKTVAHNLALIRGMALFHSLGCPLLLGASRKSFIKALTGAGDGAARAPGSVAAALWAVAQGVQILRVHDVAETRQALGVHMAIAGVTTGD